MAYETLDLCQIFSLQNRFFFSALGYFGTDLMGLLSDSLVRAITQPFKILLLDFDFRIRFLTVLLLLTMLVLQFEEFFFLRNGPYFWFWLVFGSSQRAKFFNAYLSLVILFLVSTFTPPELLASPSRLISLTSTLLEGH